VAFPQFTGVSIDPVDGSLVLLDSYEGLFTLDGEQIANHATLVVDWMEMPYTDVAALGDGKYAYTIQNDGLLYDANTREASVYFCYEPGFMAEEAFQITNSLAFDVVRQKLIAQPQSYDEGGLFEAQVAEFNLSGGQPVGWHVLEKSEFSAGGMAIDNDGLLLGGQDIIYSYAYGDRAPKPLVNLSTLGIEHIEGMALTEDGHLFIIDGQDQELVELEGWRPIAAL
jgi:hypothetical protein